MEGSLSELARLRPGGHQLRREVVVGHQRQRIVKAAVELIAERGYRAVSVAAIVKRAGTARLKFYENFSSKEDCFLVAYGEALAEAGRRLAEARAGAGESLAEQVDAGIGALLAFAAAEPALTRACLLEAPSLGAAMAGRRAEALAAFAPLLAAGREADGGDELPAGLEESVLDGLYWLLYDALLSGEPDSLEELRPALVEFALLPFLGPTAARQAVSG